jgi:hypothetical protein
MSGSGSSVFALTARGGLALRARFLAEFGADAFCHAVFRRDGRGLDAPIDRRNCRPQDRFPAKKHFHPAPTRITFKTRDGSSVARRFRADTQVANGGRL